VTCQNVESGNVAERYVRCLLEEPERTAFEEHFFVCQKCLEEVRVWRALQQTEAPVTGPRRAANLYVWAAAAAAVAAILFMGGSGMARVGSHFGLPPLVARNPAPGTGIDSVKSLGAVEAPHYQAPVLRGTVDSSEQRFHEAMERYSRHDYRAAADGLQASLSTNPGSAAARFYLGICDLLLGRADEAIIEFRRTEAAGPSLYLEEARFFRAKALLSKRDLGGASQALESVVLLSGDRQAEARRLLTQLQALSR
jgi:tetratricopeptide (TPR) repeat protein